VQRLRAEHNPSARLPYSSRIAERRDRVVQDEPDDSEQQLPSEAANHHPELFPDERRSLDDLRQIPVEEQTLVHQDLRLYRLERCVSDAWDGERPQPFPDESPELPHHHPELPLRPDNPDEDAGRSVFSDRPEEEEEQDM